MDSAANDMRRRILLKTQGLADVRRLVRDDGSVVGVDELGRYFQDLPDNDTLGTELDALNEMAATETVVSQDLPCMVHEGVKKEVETIKQTSQSTREFRAKLMTSTVTRDLLCGIHFFHWDGTLRRVIDDVEWACCAYTYAYSDIARTIEIIRMISILNALCPLLSAAKDDLEEQNRLLEKHSRATFGLPSLDVSRAYMKTFRDELLVKLNYCGPPSTDNVYDVYVRPFLSRHVNDMIARQTPHAFKPCPQHTHR
jgi:hypothetical protein